MAKRAGSTELGVDCDGRSSAPASRKDAPASIAGQGRHPTTRKRGGERGRAVNRGETRPGPRSTPSRKRQKLDVTPPFACPFARFDPVHHMDCMTFDLRRIQDVKQHLKRKHYKPFLYCPTCAEEFSDVRRRDEHIRERVCTVYSLHNDEVLSTGLIPPDKQDELRARLGGSDEETWYGIWGILFDDTRPPISPYRMTLTEVAADVLCGCWKQHKSKIVSSVLQALPLHTRLEIRRQLPALLPIILRGLVSALTEIAHHGDSISQQPSPTSDYPGTDGSTAESAETHDHSGVSSTSTPLTDAALIFASSPQPLLGLPESPSGLMSIPRSVSVPTLFNGYDDTYDIFGTFKEADARDMLGVHRPLVNTERAMDQPFEISDSILMPTKSWQWADTREPFMPRLLDDCSYNAMAGPFQPRSC